jgi:hypothetical protein
MGGMVIREMIDPEQQSQAVEQAGWLSQHWQWFMSVVAIPLGIVLHKNRERIAILENRVCDSAQVTKIVKEENEPIQAGMNQLIKRMGEHNDNVNDRMNQISDTMTTIAMHIGPNGPRNRRGDDRE